MGLHEVGRLLMKVGMALLAIGGALWAGGRFLPLGRLPGDIAIRKGNFTFYFPLATCLALSLLGTLLLWVFRRK